MPTPTVNSPFYERVFIQSKSVLRTANNNGGTWSNTAAQLVRVMGGSLQMSPAEPLVNAQWKHGSRSQLQKIKGRKAGTWSMNIPVVPSGTPGTKPDMDILLQAIFGGAPVVQAGVSCTYNIFDQGQVLFDIFDFNHGVTGIGNRYALGCIVTGMTLTLNGDILEIQLNGQCVTVVQDVEFSVVDAIAKGGLTTFPAEPSTFSTIGSIIPGFGGNISLDGANTPQMCDSFQVQFTPGYGFKGNFIDDAYPAQVLMGQRTVSINVSMQNSNSAVLNNLKQKARTGTPVDGLVTLGSTSGLIVSAGFTGIQLQPATLNEQADYIECTFGQSDGSALPGASSEFYLSFT